MTPSDAFNSGRVIGGITMSSNMEKWPRRCTSPSLVQSVRERRCTSPVLSPTNTEFSSLVKHTTMALLGITLITRKVAVVSQ